MVQEKAQEATVQHVTVVGDEARLDRALVTHIPNASRSQIKQWILDGRVRCLDGPVVLLPKSKVIAGQVFEVTPAPPAPSTLTPRSMPLDVLDEDDVMIVLNKPPGLVVHPAPGHREDTLVNGLLAARPLAARGGFNRPGIVHRLDKDTSGLLVVAKTDEAHRHLARQFAKRTAGRAYLALVAGSLRPKVGTIDAPIGRHPVKRQRMTVRDNGRAAQTSYQVMEEHNRLTLVMCRLATGRTHQIRVHLAHRGHPVVGDRLYGSDGRFHRQALHARHLTFTHPVDGERRHYTATLPADMEELLQRYSFDLEGIQKIANPLESS